MKTLRLFLLSTLLISSPALAQISIGPASNREVPAGDDFACGPLENCWDMSQRRDIQYEEYYQAGTVNVLNGIWRGTQSTSEGFIPSGPSTDPASGFVMPLFGGFLNGSSAVPLSGDKRLPLAGLYEPIEASKYTTLSFRMNHNDRSDIVLNWQRFDDVASDDLFPAPTDPLASVFDGFEISTEFIKNQGFTLYSFDLSSLSSEFDSFQGAWNGDVHSLRIEPSIEAADGSLTQFDWIRLVDPTSAPNHTVNWMVTDPPSFGVVTVFYDTDASGYDGTPMARFDSFLDPGSFTFPTAILPPGDYYFYVEAQEVMGGGQSQNISTSNFIGLPERSGYSGRLRINNPPTAKFLSPTKISGKDYAESVRGKEWNMDLVADISNLDRMIWPENLTRGFRSEGFFTSPEAELGGSFFRATTEPIFSGENPFTELDPSDFQRPFPKDIRSTTLLLETNPLLPIDPEEYRYLTFRMRSSTSAQSIYSRLSRGHYASVNFGRFLFGEDLENVDPSVALESLGSTLNTPVYEGWQTYSIDLWENDFGDGAEWLDLFRISQLGIVPLETNSGVRFDIDWVKLTANNRSENDSFEIALEINDVEDSIFTLELYYTSNFDSGTLIETFSNVTPGTFTYSWDTSDLVEGEEYDVYAIISDSKNTTQVWSRAPVTIGAYEAELPDFRSPLDYDGDGISDQTVYRPSNGFYYQNRSTFGLAAISWVAGDGYTPVQGDFDGDNRTDIALVFEFFGYLGWYITLSSTNTVAAVVWGFPNDEIAVADYNGDGRDQIAVFRNGTWYILNEDGSGYGVSWGVPGDMPAPGDYDGDGIDDLAVFRPDDGEGFSSWYIIRSNDSGAFSVDWGLPGDVPVPADWSSSIDGITDFGVYRPANGTWYTLDLANEELGQQQWGLPFVHIPVVGDFNGDGYPDFNTFEEGTAQWFHNFRNRQSATIQTGLPGDRLPLNIR